MVTQCECNLALSWKWGELPGMGSYALVQHFSSGEPMLSSQQHRDMNKSPAQ